MSRTTCFTSRLVIVCLIGLLASPGWSDDPESSPEKAPPAAEKKAEPNKKADSDPPAEKEKPADETAPKKADKPAEPASDQAADKGTDKAKETEKQEMKPQPSEQKSDSADKAEAKPADPKPADEKDKADPKKPDAPSPKEKKSEQPDANGEKKPDDNKTAKKPKPPQADPAWVAKGVWTMPPTAGPAKTDFSLVGEYAGKLSTGGKKKNQKQVGVQIRNLGEGQFEARVYQGGLPGEPKFTEKDTTVLIGRRNGNTLVLSGGPWAMFASPKECRVISFDGNMLGKLPRIERSSPTIGAKPPEGAIVLFEGKETDNLVKPRLTEDGLLQPGTNVNFLLHDFDLHLEFRIPHMPGYREQGRGNSGIYLQSRYECQVLDSFAAPKVFNGLGALYRFKPAKVNMAFPPLVWQTYDIRFTAARFAADGSKIRNAQISSWINGVQVQDNVQVPGPTGAGKDESTTLLPTLIQDHRDPVRFRNIWVIDRGLTGNVPFPPLP